MSSKTQKIAAIYIITLMILSGILTALVIINQDNLTRAALSFILPDAWVDSLERHIDQFIHHQTHLFVNILVSVLFIVMPIVLSPICEMFSESYEADLSSHHESHHEANVMNDRSLSQSVSQSILDSALLLVIYVSLTLLTLRLSIYDGTRGIANALSFIVTMFVIAVDFISPTLSRHKLKPTDIYKSIVVDHPIISIKFALTQSIILIALGYLIVSNLNAVSGFICLVVLNIIMLTASTLIGTSIAVHILRDTPVHHSGLFKYSFWGVITLSLIMNVPFFQRVTTDLYHISPVLKCHWQMIPGSLKINQSRILSLEKTIQFDVKVTNSTNRLAEVGENTITAFHKETLLGETQLPMFSVPAHTSLTQTIKVSIKGNLNGLLVKGSHLTASVLSHKTKEALKSAIDVKNYHLNLRLPTVAGPFEIRIK